MLLLFAGSNSHSESAPCSCSQKSCLSKTRDEQSTVGMGLTVIGRVGVYPKAYKDQEF